VRTTVELRGEILGAARAEFARYGLAGARIDRIARVAHASKERLYAHFGDKETLFREVVAADFARFFRGVTLRPDDVPGFVGEVYDLSCAQPEHHRMLTWAHLEGFTFDEPRAEDDQPIFGQAIAALHAAQDSGHVDRAWAPMDLLTLLFAVALSWAHMPHRESVTDDASVLVRRRAAAVEAATRIIATRT
jgi:TetR/AcrR family transcriptional regulator